MASRGLESQYFHIARAHHLGGVCAFWVLWPLTYFFAYISDSK